MPVIARTNTAQTIIDHVVSTLQAADSASSVDAFDAVVLVTEENRGKEIKAKGKLCQVVCGPDGRRELDHNTSHDEPATVVRCEVVVTWQLATADSIGDNTNLITEGQDWIDLIINALQADRTRGGSAEWISHDELLPTEVVSISGPSEFDQGWGRVSVTFDFGFTHTETGR